MSVREGRTRPGARTGRLLERERELDTLAAVIGAAADGTAGFVLVQGPAGIGKSRLLVEARMLAEERGLCVRSARGGELERDFPFGIVRQLFESQLVDESERSRLLSGAAREAAPVFGQNDARGADEPLVEGTFAILHGLFWLTVNLCSERAAVAGGGRSSLVRQCLVAVSRLSGAAAGRPSGRARREPAVFGA